MAGKDNENVFNIIDIKSIRSLYVVGKINLENVQAVILEFSKQIILKIFKEIEIIKKPIDNTSNSNNKYINELTNRIEKLFDLIQKHNEEQFKNNSDVLTPNFQLSQILNNKNQISKLDNILNEHYIEIKSKIEEAIAAYRDLYKDLYRKKENLKTDSFDEYRTDFNLLNTKFNNLIDIIEKKSIINSQAVQNIYYLCGRVNKVIDISALTSLFKKHYCNFQEIRQKLYYSQVIVKRKIENLTVTIISDFDSTIPSKNIEKVIREKLLWPSSDINFSTVDSHKIHWMRSFLSLCSFDNLKRWDKQCKNDLRSLFKKNKYVCTISSDNKLDIIVPSLTGEDLAGNTMLIEAARAKLPECTEFILRVLYKKGLLETQLLHKNKEQQNIFDIALKNKYFNHTLVYAALKLNLENLVEPYNLLKFLVNTIIESKKFTLNEERKEKLLSLVEKCLLTLEEDTFEILAKIAENSKKYECSSKDPNIPAVIFESEKQEILQTIKSTEIIKKFIDDPSGFQPSRYSEEELCSAGDLALERLCFLLNNGTETLETETGLLLRFVSNVNEIPIPKLEIFNEDTVILIDKIEKLLNPTLEHNNKQSRNPSDALISNLRLLEISKDKDFLKLKDILGNQYEKAESTVKGFLHNIYNWYDDWKSVKESDKYKAKCNFQNNIYPKLRENLKEEFISKKETVKNTYFLCKKISQFPDIFFDISLIASLFEEYSNKYQDFEQEVNVIQKNLEKVEVNQSLDSSFFDPLFEENYNKYKVPKQRNNFLGFPNSFYKPPKSESFIPKTEMAFPEWEEDEMQISGVVEVSL